MLIKLELTTPAPLDNSGTQIVMVYDIMVFMPSIMSKSPNTKVVKSYLEYGQSAVCARISIKDF